MKTLILITVAVSLMTSCTKEKQTTHYIEPSLRCFYDSFIKEANARNVKFARDASELGMYSFKLKGWNEGITYYDDNQIFISKVLVDSNLGHSYNDHVDSLEVQYVVWHELGHYLLGRGHVGDSVVSIMTPESSYKLKYMHKANIRNTMNNELFTDH